MRRLLAFVTALAVFLYGTFPAFGSEPDLKLGGYGDGMVASSEAVRAAGEEKALETAAQEVREGPEISAPSAILMEASTGQVICEKGADEQRSPASITKIMTLILIFDALESGKISLDDEVVTSAHAKSMGGSQVFLEEGEVQTVDTLIKCIVVASGNDASVAMAEYIAGSEEEFVNQMNERAAGLGMTGTHFVDCCGLTEDPAHRTTARDIALMSRELINRYPAIHDYATIWMDTITHVTNQGTKEFGLANTNKLLKMATNFTVTGLKTGSTSAAKYCLSATAEKDGVRLIAVVMAAPDFKARFSDAVTLLNYGYANCRLYEDREGLPLPQMAVTGGGGGPGFPGLFRHLFLSGYERRGFQPGGAGAGAGGIPAGPGGSGPAGGSSPVHPGRKDAGGDFRGDGGRSGEGRDPGLFKEGVGRVLPAGRNRRMTGKNEKRGK